ncbi:hypothetical protein EMN47_11790 [Prolixibacteraceae bacterium JC049]|nr:hypothetical protein [Prolixibacteraceae bacterium JC049]
MKNVLKGLAGVLFLTFALFSCESDSSKPKVEVKTLKGAFVVNEGNFGKNNGTIIWQSLTGEQKDEDLFKTVNKGPLGDVVQSFTVVDTLGFIVVNNSQKVEIVHMKDFKSVGRIENLSYPRYVAKAGDGKVYISNGNGKADGNDKLIIYDYAKMAKAGEIEVGKGPERFAELNNLLYVVNSGAWSTDKTISVINTTNDVVAQTITVNDNPIDIAVDANMGVWVYCKGIPDYSKYPDVTYKNAAIVRINGVTRKVEKVYPIASIKTNGSNLLAMDKSGENVYFITDGLYKMSIGANELPITKFNDKAFYGVRVNKETGNVWAFDNTASKAVVLSTTGEKVKEYNTTAFSNDACFIYKDFVK